MSALNVAELEHARNVAEAAAAHAGELLLQHLGKLDPSAIRSKSEARDLVTAADVAAERLLVDRLRTALPDHAIEAEEEVRDALDDRPRWFLDPLDGTVNFVHGLPAFGVSMGLFDADGPAVAVLFFPKLGETFTAVRGGGAFLNGEQIHVSSTPDLGSAVIASGFPYKRDTLPNPNLENFNRFVLRVRGIRRMGSAALDLAYVAAGRLDAYWELHLSPHDMAGGALLVLEAGGRVTDAVGGQDWLRTGHIVASGPNLHSAILADVEV
jgi:myo-inositol-1(or 4)-monophosphatase